MALVSTKARKFLARTVAELYTTDFHTLYNNHSPTSLLTGCATGTIKPHLTPLQSRLANLMPGANIAMAVGVNSPPTLPTHYIMLRKDSVDGLYYLASDRVYYGNNPRNGYMFYWAPELVPVEYTFDRETRIMAFAKQGAENAAAIDKILNEREARLQLSYCARQLNMLGLRVRGDKVRVAFKNGTATFKIIFASNAPTEAAIVKLEKMAEKSSIQPDSRVILTGAQGLPMYNEMAPYGFMLGLSHRGLGEGIKLMDDLPTDMSDVNDMLTNMLYGRFLPYLGVVTPTKKDRMKLVFTVVDDAGILRLAYKWMDYNKKCPALFLKKRVNDADALQVEQFNDAWLEAMRPYFFVLADDPPSKWRETDIHFSFTMYKSMARLKDDPIEQREEIAAYYKRRGVRFL